MYLKQKKTREKNNQGEEPENQAEEPEAIELVRSEDEEEALEEEAPEEGPNELENEEEAKNTEEALGEQAREDEPRAEDEEETRKAEVTRKAKEFTQLYRASQELSDLRAQEEDEATKAEKDEERRRRDEHNESLRASLRELEDSGGGSQTKIQSALTFWTPQKKKSRSDDSLAAFGSERGPKTPCTLPLE